MLTDIKLLFGDHTMPFKNPIIPGFHPDPSMCRVGDDYYLVTSSFEYFPGIPIHHSKDLVNWRLIGHCLTRDSQLDVNRSDFNSGLYAPALRYHDGLFYMVCTNVSRRPQRAHFYVTAADPAGPWSDPVWIEGECFDPDLFWDDDGRCYFLHMDYIQRGIYMQEIDLPRGELLGEERQVWAGFEDPACEGPHLFKINGWYYLFCAEGGTGRGHMSCVSRSRDLWGPYEGHPDNPIISHRCAVFDNVKNVGHCDVVQAQDGRWWVVTLGVRTHGDHHVMGRETFLSPMEWNDEGWPVIPGKMMLHECELTPLPEHPWPAKPERDDFDSDQLDPEFVYRRNPHREDYSLTARPGYLRIIPSTSGLNGMKTGRVKSVNMVCRRQEQFRFEAKCLMEFTGANHDEEAGLTVFMHDHYHYSVCIRYVARAARILVHKEVGDISINVANKAAPASPVTLVIRGDEDAYHLGYELNGEFVILSSGMTKCLASEFTGGFAGVMIGIYATNNGKPNYTPADFDWFEYRNL
ncbi:MAG: glycoside hydrolase family 43 protein [Armatimonadota bacterium]